MPDLPQSWRDAADSVGKWIGSHGFQLVYGGVDAGLMCIAAKACKDSGGTVLGVVPTRRANQASPYNTERLPSAGLNDRKDIMQLHANIFVVLPGGYGTLDEFASTFAYINFTHQREKRVILYNPDGIYNPLLEQLNLMVERHLMEPDRLEVLLVPTNVEELIAALESCLKRLAK